MNIVVYLGSSEGNDSKYREVARATGEWIGSNGHDLIYGGSRVGLMGVIADATLGTGGRVIGVEPAFFVEGELQHNGITELIVTDDMPQRKTKMIELGDTYIAIPGGSGTLEEISEIISLLRLGFIDKPTFLINTDGYYEGLRMQLNMMVSEGFLEQEILDKIVFLREPSELSEYI